MDFSNLTLFSAITEKMKWLSAREKVLAENIANVNTPNYQATDLKPLDFTSALSQAGGKLQLASTDGAHLVAPVNGHSAYGEVKTYDEREIDGNTVSLEDELIKVSQDAENYQLVTSLYKKQIGMLKEAIGHGSSS